MSDKSDLTCKEFLDAIVAKISVEAKKPELFTKDGEWSDATRGLDELIEKLNDESDTDTRQNLQDKRNCGVRNLILLMRKQFAHCYLFNDADLQGSQGCSLLGDYAKIKESKALKLCGHKFDGIGWNEDELDQMPIDLERPFDFKVNEKDKTGRQWEYCGCLDHAISNLICIVWGYSGISGIDGTTKFKSRWQDLSLYLAVLLCFGDNILDDQTFLREIGTNLDEADTPQEKLHKVLSVPGIRGKLWERIQELIPNRG